MGRVTSAAPHLSAEEIAQRLKETVGAREHLRWLIIWNSPVDGAGWHKSTGLKIPENVKLIAQPSHSPELNPEEHIWDELRL